MLIRAELVPLICCLSEFLTGSSRHQRAVQTLACPRVSTLSPPPSLLRTRPFMAPQAICCTLVNCNCDSFKPGKLKRRQCETCKHGWVSHALSKLKVHHKFQSSQVEIVHSNVVFDICSLMLYGTQAIPVRLKILLDRLFSVLKQEEVIQILSALDWTLQDYIRGYVLQDVAGKVLDRWAIMTFEEEIATLQQFLRFGETKSIVELMALQDKEGQVVLVPNTLTNSDIRNFIERNTPRSAANLCTSKAENMSGGSMHHFENFINSMAFMLPFQLLGSAPAPFLGSPLQQQHQPCGVSLEQQGQRRDDQGRDNAFPLLHPSLNSFVGSSSIPCSTDLDHSGGNPVDSLSTTAKIEAEDFSISDNYSDRSSTPCTPSLNSDVPQMSPDGKLHSLDRSGSSSGSVSGGAGSLKKGRVFCSACEKTFYDKGTLKIHYNAVHLKIKHKCTIEGCNMVFSSLRSRNRHSANPNPRLHMPMNRNNRDKDLRSSLSADESSQGEKKTEYGNPISICSAESQRPVSSYVVSHVDSGPKLHGSSFPSSGQSGVLFSNLKTVQPVLPFYRSLVTPAELANTPGTLPSLPILSSSVPIKAIAEPKSCVTDLIPKKKSRKSSMPIKIEKDTIAHADQIEKTSSSEEELPFQASDMNYESSQAVEHRCTRQPGQQKDARDAYVGKEKEGEGIKNSINHTFDRHLADNEQKKEEGSRPAKTVVIDRTSSPSENSPLDKQNNSSLCQEPSDSEDRETREHTHSLNLCDKRSEVTTNEGGYKVTNGGSPQPTERGGLDDSGLSHFDSNLSPPCEVCSKPFKNPFSIRMHYQDVHLKEMHMCTVDGCNATFPSRRSRDRHSANPNLHRELLMKDSLIPITTLCSPSSHCTDMDSVSQDNCHDQQNTDLPHRDQTSQTSVIFRGHNRMGLVFPMSKVPAPASGDEVSPLAEANGLGGGERSVNGNNGRVLDLSTATSTPSCGSSCAEFSWNSDGAGSEEGETSKEVEEVLPIEDSDESCDETGVGRPFRDGNLGSSESGHRGLHGLGVGSSITCHVCQKVYSNKGTFRAHYKTVHLRLLHKCKVPGCDTSFSSVRSRNRHSQNPNLHRNMSANSGTAVDQE
ncbi:zinc finger protein basonuclin-1 isoform X1 [Nothobranchius furzeri]|uniref:Basonuclin 1 n=2 Tax=Nothobranchius furzeri TaxID=105023 RepID=A0A1A8A1T1_NOTFU|nr:zinc finger protein basonuclin-1 isoform X1 [Nothobranchius furzeri]KAF7212912.1 transcript variant X1 [Nothobranchius furzeri]